MSKRSLYVSVLIFTTIVIPEWAYTALIYVGNQDSNSISVIDSTKRSVIDTIPISGSGPFNLALSKDWRFLYIANIRSNDLLIMDLSTKRQVARMPTGAFTSDVALSPDGRYLYAVNNGSNDLAIIDSFTFTPVGFIQVGLKPSEVIFSRDGRYVYVTNSGSSDISV
ncbi:MAG: beta-propeller fold lactonase family protein, partial [Nitrospirota bacterium]